MGPPKSQPLYLYKRLRGACDVHHLGALEAVAGKRFALECSIAKLFSLYREYKMLKLKSTNVGLGLIVHFFLSAAIYSALADIFLNKLAYASWAWRQLPALLVYAGVLSVLCSSKAASYTTSSALIKLLATIGSFASSFYGMVGL